MAVEEKGNVELLSESNQKAETSLDLGKNKSKNSESPDSENGRYDCRETFPFFFENEGKNKKAEYRCNQWDCYCCGYRMRQNLIEEINELVKSRPEMRRFMTLTLDPKNLPFDVRVNDKKQSDYIMKKWEEFKIYVNEYYGDFSYIWVKEKQDNGNWHLHILVSRFLPQEWISDVWDRVSAGEVVDIRRVDNVNKVANYMGSYLTKNALSGFPDNVRRYGNSEDISLSVRSSSSSNNDGLNYVYGYLGLDFDWKLKGKDPISVNGEIREIEGFDFIHYKQNPEPPPT